MGLAGRLLIIYSVLFGLLLGGVVTISLVFFIQNKYADARYRVVDVIGSVHQMRKRTGENQLADYLDELFSTRFRGEGYDLGLVEIEVRGMGMRLSRARSEPAEGDVQHFHTEVRDPDSGDLLYTIDLTYELTNLQKGVWTLVLQIVGVGLGAFAVGVLLILLFARSSTRPLRSLAGAMEKVGQGKMDIRVEAKSTGEVGVLEEKFNWMMKGMEEGEFVKNIFKRYVTRQVAEKILAEKDLVHLAGDRREVSILFADIRGFTRLSQQMTPEQIISLLNHYFTPIIDVIIEREGVLDKFMGDGFLAFWNAPLPQEDHAMRSCQAAILIQEVISRLNAERGNQGLDPIHMGMGVNTGTAIAGNIGSSQRMEYTIIGESVNFAQRLQETADKGEILVSPRTAALVGNRLRFKRRRIKIEDYGDKQIEVFELIQSPQEAK